MKTMNYLNLDASKLNAVQNGLSQLLADLQVFYTNLRNFHWNIKGHGFFVLHSEFEKLYDDVAEKVDEVAERLLQLGGQPEHKFSVYLQQAQVKETEITHCGEEAVKNVLDTLGLLIAQERQVLSAASEAHDEVTVSLMSDYLKGQEKLVWMLVAFSTKGHTA